MDAFINIEGLLDNTPLTSIKKAVESRNMNIYEKLHVWGEEG